jgi:hypothetical protein
MEKVSVEVLITVGAILLSLAASYLPGFSGWYAGLKSEYKQLLMLGMLFLAAGVAFGVSCLKLETWVTCDVQGAWGLFKLFVQAVMVNQSTYLITKRKTEGVG